MGWKLVAEILDHCPDIRYREFRILIALALDSRDETRQGMPGLEVLTLRGNCGMRTTQRAMSELTAAGLVKMIKRPAPGRRAVWEILPLATHDSMVSSVRTTEPGQRTTKTSPTHDTPLHGAVLVNLSSHRPKSSLSRARAALEAAGAAEREIDFIIDTIENNPKIKSPAAYLTTAIGNGDAGALVIGARVGLADNMRSEATRLDEDAEGLEAQTGDGPHSNACRAADHRNCSPAWYWCTCTCHSPLSRAERQADMYQRRAAVDESVAHSIAEAKTELARIRQEKRS